MEDYLQSSPVGVKVYDVKKDRGSALFGARAKVNYRAMFEEMAMAGNTS